MIDHWWQTETGWPVGCNCVGLGLLPVKPGSCGVPVPGYDVRVLTTRARRSRAGETGNVVIKLPLAAGLPADAVEQRRAAYQASYLSAYPGYYLTADAGYQGRGRLPLDHEPHRRRDQRGGPSALHRGDGGGAGGASRTSPSARWSASPTRSRARCRSVWWCSRPGAAREREELVAELVALVRERIGPVASFKVATLVKRLPKTRSGKIVRGTIKKIADGAPYTDPADDR